MEEIKTENYGPVVDEPASSRLTRKRLLIGTAAIITVLAIIGAVVILRRDSQPEVAKDSSAIAQTVANMPQRPGLHPTMRLKEGLVPPTNKWFSSVAFSNEPQPIYAYPMTFKPTASGFEASYPNLTGTGEAIFQIHRPDVTVNFDADRYQVDNYDDLSVTIGYYNNSGDKIATVVATHGSPYIFVTADSTLTLAISEVAATQKNDDYFTLKRGERNYGLVSSKPFMKTGDTLTTELTKNTTFSTYAIAEDNSMSALRAAALEPITKTAVNHKQNGNELETTFDLTTESGKATIFASLPHQTINSSDAPSGKYDSLYGPMTLHAGNSFSYNAAVPAIPDRLDISNLSNEQKSEVSAQLKADIASTTLNKPDSYFGGKELYRAANLLELADQLGMTTERDQLTTMMSVKLTRWLTVAKNPADTAHYFYYDTTIKGVVGVEPAFGSDQFNDHHFHYGYFIYAASVLAKYDSEFLAQNRNMIDVIIADIANSSTTELFPKLRVFDPYVGHSWASGYGDFADGNNQESVSEAVNAWYGMHLWSKVTDNAELASTSNWLYQQESEAALRYWFLKDGAPAKNYTPPFVSLRWGGKLDYSTFFSPRPQAKLGILLIPMSPGQGYLEQSTEQAKQLLRSVEPGPEDFHGQFGDYLVMYESLVDPASAQAKARQLLSTDIDDGNSRSYVLAWVYSQSPR